MSDEEANNGTTRAFEGFNKLPSTTGVISESLNRCSNPECRCNKPKEKKLKKCWFGRHNFHLDIHKDIYICKRCGEV